MSMVPAHSTYRAGAMSSRISTGLFFCRVSGGCLMVYNLVPRVASARRRSTLVGWWDPRWRKCHRKPDILT